MSVQDGRISSDQFMHTHTFKAALGKIVNFVNPDLNYNYDAGQFYAENLPSFFWIFALISLPILIVLSLLLLLKLKQELELNHYLNFFLFIYIISAFSMLKNTLDGGLISAEAMVWLAIFIATIYFTTLKKYLQQLVTLFISGFIVLIINFSILKPSINNPINILFIEYLSYIFFFLLIFNSYYNLKKNKILLFLGGIIIYILWVIIIFQNIPAAYYNFSLNSVPQLLQEVPANSYINIFNYNNYKHPNCEKMLYSEKDFYICQIKINQTTSLRKLINDYTIIPMNNHPITIPEVDCDPDIIYTEISHFILIKGNLPEKINNSLINIEFEKTMNFLGKYPIYKYEVNAKGCIPNYTNFLDRIMNDYGMRSYIILDERYLGD